MQAKTLTLSKNKAAYFLYLMRKNIPYMLMYSVIFFITSFSTIFGSLSKYLMLGNSPSLYSTYSLYTSYNNIFSFPLLIIAPFLAAILNFRFLTNRQANDMMFSMPISKKNLFFSNYFAGASSYLIPYIIFKNPFWMFLSYQNNQTNEQTVDFFKLINTSLVSFGISILLFLACFSLAVFLCVNIGKIFDACLYYGLLSVFAPIAFSGIMAIFNSSLFGIVNTGTFYSGSVTIPEILSTVICRLFSVNYYSVPNSDLAVQTTRYNLGILVPICTYLVLGIGFALLSYYLFKKRPREKTDTPFAFDYMKTVLAVIVSFFIGIVFTLIFSLGNSTLDKMLLSLVPFIIVSLVVYLGAIAVANRSFKVFNKKTFFYAIPLVLYFVIVSYFSTGGFGAVTYIPKAIDVQKVTMNLDTNRLVDNSSNTNELSLLNLSGIKNDNTNIQNVTFVNAKNIEAVTKFHGKILEFYKQFDFEYNRINQKSVNENNNYSPKIIYTLKNGKEVIRQYNNIDSSLLSTEYNNISNQSDGSSNDETVTEEQLINRLNTYDLNNITISTWDMLPDFMLNCNTSNLNVSSDDVKSLILAIYKDENSFKSNAEYVQNKYITIRITGETGLLYSILPGCLNLSINENYANTIAVLNKLGIYKTERSLNQDHYIKAIFYRNLPESLNTSSVKTKEIDGKTYFFSTSDIESLDYDLEPYKINTISVYKDYEKAAAIINDVKTKTDYNQNGIIVKFTYDHTWDNGWKPYSPSYFLPEGSDGYYAALGFLK